MKSKLRAAPLNLVVLLACTFVSLLVAPSKATAQGCTLCRDTTAGSSPQVRKALRIAIPLLGVPALGLFAGTLVLARRVKPGQQ
jgi:hypothetical protein